MILRLLAANLLHSASKSRNFANYFMALSSQFAVMFVDEICCLELIELAAVVLLSEMVSFRDTGFKSPSICSPAKRLDSPGSLTIKIRPFGAEANSVSSFVSNGRTLPGAGVLPVDSVAVLFNLKGARLFVK